jgi:hypothetical protein
VSIFDQVLDGVVAELDPLRAAAWAESERFTLKRYMGERFNVEDAETRGVAGRTPAVLVALVGDRPVRTTIGGRRALNELTLQAICASDSHRSKDDRAVVLSMVADVRKQLGGRRLGLPIQPLRYSGIDVVAEHEKLFAYAARFTARYRVSYAKDPGADLLLAADGQIGAPLDPLVGPPAPTLSVNGTAGTASYGYDLQVQRSGSLTDFGPWASVHTAPNALGGANSIGVTWPAQAGAVAYRLRRRWSPAGGPAVGVIYTGGATSFIDDGTVAGDGNVAPVHGVALQETF